jgi:hypothetical protein
MALSLLRLRAAPPAGACSIRPVASARRAAAACPAAAALAPPPALQLLAPRRRGARAASRRAAPAGAVAKWVLIPIGTGDCTHLDTAVALPSTIVLGDAKIVVGRDLSPTVNLSLPVPTGAGACCHATSQRRGSARARVREAPSLAPRGAVTCTVIRTWACIARMLISLLPARAARSVRHARDDRRRCGRLLCD